MKTLTLLGLAGMLGLLALPGCATMSEEAESGADALSVEGAVGRWELHSSAADATLEVRSASPFLFDLAIAGKSGGKADLKEAMAGVADGRAAFSPDDDCSITLRLRNDGLEVRQTGTCASEGFAGGVVATGLYVRVGAEAPAADPTSIDLPKGMRYTDARSKLLAEGWEPVPSDDPEQACTGGEYDDRCYNRPETQSCSGTGNAPCVYLWQNGEDVRLVINTTGEEPTIASTEILRKQGAPKEVVMGMRYTDARGVLVREGWEPIESDDPEQACPNGEGDDRCYNRPETQSCSGTGEAPCAYAWYKSGTRLYIDTKYENPEIASIIIEW